MQMADICEKWKIPCLNLADIRPGEIAQQIETLNPKIILCSIENIVDEAVQRALRKLKVDYVAVDECQVHLTY